MKSLLFVPLFFATLVAAQTGDHAKGVDSRGDQAMGFSHQMTAHHFVLLPDGGLIIANANDPNDENSRDEIRQHMEHIAKLFSAGGFDLPMFIHDRVPPGVVTMKRLTNQIKYAAQSTPLGAQVSISTPNTDGIQAIHDFLRFQIEDHRTGDAESVTQKPVEGSPPGH